MLVYTVGYTCGPGRLFKFTYRHSPAQRYSRRMVVIVLVVLGIVVVAAMVVIVFGGVLSLEREQAKAEKNADQILDAAFDGRSDVTFTVNMRTLKYETVVLGAKRRGYRLASQAANEHGPHTLIFEKTETTESPAPISE